METQGRTISATPLPPARQIARLHQFLGEDSCWFLVDCISIVSSTHMFWLCPVYFHSYTQSLFKLHQSWNIYLRWSVFIWCHAAGTLVTLKLQSFRRLCQVCSNGQFVSKKCQNLLAFGILVFWLNIGLEIWAKILCRILFVWEINLSWVTLKSRLDWQASQIVDSSPHRFINSSWYQQVARYKVREPQYFHCLWICWQEMLLWVYRPI